MKKELTNIGYWGILLSPLLLTNSKAIIPYLLGVFLLSSFFHFKSILKYDQSLTFKFNSIGKLSLILFVIGFVHSIMFSKSLILLFVAIIFLFGGLIFLSKSENTLFLLNKKGLTNGFKIKKKRLFRKGRLFTGEVSFQKRKWMNVPVMFKFVNGSIIGYKVNNSFHSINQNLSVDIYKNGKEKHIGLIKPFLSGC